MKRKDLVRLLQSSGCILARRGGRHDLFLNPANGKRQPVPRHAEINESLARHILKHLGVSKS